MRIFGIEGLGARRTKVEELCGCRVRGLPLVSIVVLFFANQFDEDPIIQVWLSQTKN